MTIDYVKQEIPTQICEEGGATARIVNNKVLALGTAVDEAINGHYAMGDSTLITSEVAGVVKSMVENCAKDGNARQIGDYFTVSPTYYGLIDADKGHDPLVNGVELKIRLLNQLKVDTSKWTFNDVTPGKLPIKVNNVSTGAVVGIVNYGDSAAVKFTGHGLGVATRVDWSVTGTTHTGTIPSTGLGKSATVLTATGGITGLPSTCDGKTIVFTVYGEKNCATVSGTLHYVEQTPTLTSIQQGNRAAGNVGFGNGAEYAATLTGTIPGGFKETDGLKVDGAPTTAEGTDYTASMSLKTYVTASTDTTITLGNGFVNDSSKPDVDWNGKNAQIVLVRDGVEYPLTFAFSAA